MSKAKVLFVTPSSASTRHGVSQALTDLGYEVSNASTPEETVLTAMELDPQVIIWPDALNGESAWSRVKNILEAKNPLISLSNDFNAAALEDKAVAVQTNETPRAVNVPLATMNALVEQLEQIGTHGSGNHQFYTKVGNKLRRIELDEVTTPFSGLKEAFIYKHVSACQKILAHPIDVPFSEIYRCSGYKPTSPAQYKR